MMSINRTAGSATPIELVAMQLAFSTADVQRSIFFNRVAERLETTPNVRNLEEQGASVWQSPGPTEVEATPNQTEHRVAVLAGQFVAIDPTEPPNAIPLTEEAGLVQLVKQQRP